jgi:two-component system OmpR family response regulator
MKTKVLVVEDDGNIRFGLVELLTSEGFAVEACARGDQALDAVEKHRPALIVLDIMLPGLSGYDVCKQLRARKYQGLILVLTAKGQEMDKVIGLELGADDYVPKPFNPRELLARIRAVLRRAGDQADHRLEAGVRSYRFGGWTLEPARRRLLNPEGVEVPLTGGEYDLLVALVERANRVLTRDMLLDLLRGRQAGPFDRAIDVAVSRLRRKLEDDGRNAQLIKTVRGGGYVLAATVERL